MNTTTIAPGTLLADGATTTTQTGTCAICLRTYARGERIARLVVMTSGWVHASCTGRITAKPQRR